MYNIPVLISPRDGISAESFIENFNKGNLLDYNDFTYMII